MNIEIMRSAPTEEGWTLLAREQVLTAYMLDVMDDAIRSARCIPVFVEAGTTVIDEMTGAVCVDILARHKNNEQIKMVEVCITDSTWKYWDRYGQRIILPVALNDQGDKDLSVLIRSSQEIGWDHRGLRVIKAMLPVSVEATEVECSETGLITYDQYAYAADMWDAPFDKDPVTKHFINGHAYDCYFGHIYSKDFRYFECCECGRVICEQAPRNGWHVQYRTRDEGCEQICLQCYEEDILENGINIDDLKHDIPGMFMDNGMLDKGWAKHDDYFVNASNRDYVKGKIRALYDSGYKVLISYALLAIGGSEGYIDVYKKPREVDLCKNASNS